jgi:hypothetical protein
MSLGVERMSYRTDYLVPASSFLIGVGSLLNFTGSYIEYNHSQTTEQADQRALRNDWNMVGQDIHAVLKKVSSEGIPEDVE